MSYFYAMNCGQYVLHDPQGNPVGPVMDSVALALDKVEGVLFKHGSFEMVQRWLSQTQTKLRAQGEFGAEMAANLVIIEGRFELEELNRCLSTTGYAGRLYQQTMQRLGQG